MMRIGILEAGEVNPALRPTYGTYPQMFARLLDGHGFEFQTWSVVNGEFPASPADADAWLITGSRHGVYEGHAWIPPLEDFICAAKAASVPMAGICFGHQIMAQALGGAVAKSGKGWGVGRQEYAVGDRPMAILAFHQDQVQIPPAGAEVTATSDFCEFAALSYGDWGRSWQAHPEFTPAYCRDLLAIRAGVAFSHDHAADALTTVDDPIDSPAVAAQIAAFFLAHDPASI
ncbi:MAG: GMP synthase-like glutamine amidotransferase [Paracoccaceae bacterium]|jgi:GMP synthase-like glutamine amidotransferase